MNVRLAPSERHLSDQLKSLLASADRPMGAYELAQKLSEATGKRQFPNSIYRALHRMRDEGDAIELVSNDRWAWRFIKEEGPVLALICNACGACRLRSDPELVVGLQRIAAETGFQVSRMHLEIEGQFSHCTGTSHCPYTFSGSR